MEAVNNAHVLCIPFPGQGHINPMMQMAKLLHSRGFFVTFVNTQFTHKRIFGSEGPELTGLSGRFRFETLSDGVPSSIKEIMDDVEEFCRNIRENCEEPLRGLLKKLQEPTNGVPPVTCVVADGAMGFVSKVIKEMGLPGFVFIPAAACSLMAASHYPELIKRGFIPLKDENQITNGYLDTIIDWIPGMRDMKLKDLGSFIRTTDPNDFFLHFLIDFAQDSFKFSSIIFNTFDDLECDVLGPIRSKFSRVYTIGPLPLQCHLIPKNEVALIKSSLWKEDTTCLNWLAKQKSGSVVYVNFGSTTVMTAKQLEDFAWGIAHSKQSFLWVIRPDLVISGEANLSEDFLKEIEGRGMLVNWCPQEEVLAHSSVALFLTHCGWNSTLESISHGVPMLCYPFFADQQINCRYVCKEWSLGTEINGNATREEVKGLIKEFMEGEKGMEMRQRALKWQKSAKDAVKEGGSSHSNLEMLVRDIPMQKGQK